MPFFLPLDGTVVYSPNPGVDAGAGAGAGASDRAGVELISIETSNLLLRRRDLRAVLISAFIKQALSPADISVYRLQIIMAIEPVTTSIFSVVKLAGNFSIKSSTACNGTYPARISR